MHTGTANPCNEFAIILNQNEGNIETETEENWAYLGLPLTNILKTYSNICKCGTQQESWILRLRQYLQKYHTTSNGILYSAQYGTPGIKKTAS